MPRRIPVYTFKINPNQLGNGLYEMVACFIHLAIHVPFVFEAHSENEYLQSVGEPTPCDGSCKNHVVKLYDFATERHHSSYEVEKIIAKAIAYKKPG